MISLEDAEKRLETALRGFHEEEAKVKQGQVNQGSTRLHVRDLRVLSPRAAGRQIARGRKGQGDRQAGVRHQTYQKKSEAASKANASSGGGRNSEDILIEKCHNQGGRGKRGGEHNPSLTAGRKNQLTGDFEGVEKGILYLHQYKESFMPDSNLPGWGLGGKKSGGPD